jgi:hypothetical protein
MNRKTRPLTGLLTLGVSLLLAAHLQAQKSNFSLGTATGTELSRCTDDPGGMAGNCWGLNISCPNVTAIQPYDATVKLTSPAGQSGGTIIFITGGGGMQYYDTGFTYGTVLIDDLVGAGFTVAQIVFNNPVDGWLTGPALDGNGPIALACLPSTAMQWVYNHVLTPGTPLCATGNSGGSAAIAYALSQYGLGSILTLAEPSSGPVLTRMDYGCSPATKYSACSVCGYGTQYESYGLKNTEQIVDPAYTGVYSGKPNGPCSQGVDGSTADAALFHHDSVLSDIYPPQLSFATQVRVVFGGLDYGGGALPEGLDWVSFITSSATVICVPTAAHEIADSLAGEAQLESDLATYCKLP